MQLVLNRTNAFTGINVKNAEGVLKRKIDYQVVNEYRGAISALNSGAPFMFTKADSLLGRSVLEFARAIDRAGAASVMPEHPQLAPSRASGVAADARLARRLGLRNDPSWSRQMRGCSQRRLSRLSPRA